MRDSGRAPAVCASIIETARQCNLDKVGGSVVCVCVVLKRRGGGACWGLLLRVCFEISRQCNLDKVGGLRVVGVYV